MRPSVFVLAFGLSVALAAQACAQRGGGGGCMSRGSGSSAPRAGETSTVFRTPIVGSVETAGNYRQQLERAYAYQMQLSYLQQMQQAEAARVKAEEQQADEKRQARIAVHRQRREAEL